MHLRHSFWVGLRPNTLSLIVILFPAVIGLVDCIWAEWAKFSIDAPGYFRLALLTGLFWAGGWFYEKWRMEARLAALLYCTCFLIGFTAAGSVLNVMLVSIAGTRIDALLARTDMAMGFNWPALMHSVANHPALLSVLQAAYGVYLPEVALAVMIIGVCGPIGSVYRYVFAVAIGALICIFVWTLWPSFGAMSYYSLDPVTITRLHVPVDGAYGDTLVHMLNYGPGLISPHNVNGLIGFPSFHAVMALLLMWYFRNIAGIRWVIWAVNFAVILSTPVEGGHHLVDVIAALPVTALAVAGARSVYRLLTRAGHPISLTTGQVDTASW